VFTDRYQTETGQTIKILVAINQLTLHGHIITARQRTIITYNKTVIGTLAVDGWAVTFGTARRGFGGLGPRPVPYSL